MFCINSHFNQLLQRSWVLLNVTSRYVGDKTWFSWTWVTLACHTYPGIVLKRYLKDLFSSCWILWKHKSMQIQEWSEIGPPWLGKVLANNVTYVMVSLIGRKLAQPLIENWFRWQCPSTTYRTSRNDCDMRYQLICLLNVLRASFGHWFSKVSL